MYDRYLTMHPIYTTILTPSNTIKTPINQIKTFKEYQKENIYPVAIIDIACIDKGKFLFGTEIKYIYAVDNEKLLKMKKMAPDIII